jgi:hypothetical protein
MATQNSREGRSHVSAAWLSMLCGKMEARVNSTVVDKKFPRRQWAERSLCKEYDGVPWRIVYCWSWLGIQHIDVQLHSFGLFLGASYFDTVSGAKLQVNVQSYKLLSFCIPVVIPARSGCGVRAVRVMKQTRALYWGTASS